MMKTGIRLGAATALLIFLAACTMNDFRAEQQIPDDAGLKMLLLEGRLAPEDATCKPVEMVHPRYPLEAARNSLGGSVTLMVDVNENGSVSEVYVIESSPGDTFVAVAAQAAIQWEFDTESHDGEPHNMRCELPMKFDPPT